MQRRNFLKLASTLGTVVPAWALTPAAFSQTASAYTGRIFINIHASGGIDQSSWTDPRETDATMNSYAGVTPVVEVGNLRVAPMGNNAAFFQKYYKNILVINGVNSETNSHSDGTRVNATGSLALGYPNIAELFAANTGHGLPLPWLNAGGYTMSAGLLPPTAVPSTTIWNSMAQPNAASATNDYMKQADITRIQMARAERLQALKASGTLLPRQQMVADEFLAASDSRALMARVAANTPPAFDKGFTTAHVALVAAQSGITTAIQLSAGGFDAHSNIDDSYAKALPGLTNLVDFIWTKAAELGLSKRITLYIYSEFGRTPHRNNNNGKDHFLSGSRMLMEDNPAWGNRVFGASGPQHQTLKINTSTGAVDPVNGVVIRPRHIHAALRTYLGATTSNPKFSLKVPANESFDFFNVAANTGYPNR